MWLWGDRFLYNFIFGCFKTGPILILMVANDPAGHTHEDLDAIFKILWSLLESRQPDQEEMEGSEYEDNSDDLPALESNT